MIKHILLYTDFPKFGVASWNNITKRNLEKHYKVTYACSDNERDNFHNFLLQTKPDLTIFSDKGPESNRSEKTKCILQGIPYIFIAHLATQQYVDTCKEKELVSYLLNGAKQVVAVSQSTLRSLRQLGLADDKGVVIYPCSENIFDPKKFMGVGANDPMHFRTLLEIPRNAKVFLTVARIDISKGYKVQLEVINNLRKQDEKLFENLHWFWVGNGADYYQLSGILQDTALNTNVHMFGQIDRDLLPSIYASSDVFVLPSFCEGTPLVLLEAIAMELPIIATKVDGVKEILTEETAFLLDDPSKQPINDMLEYAYRLFSTDNVVTKKYKENIKKERERCQHNPNWRYTEEVFIQHFLNVLKGVGI